MSSISVQKTDGLDSFTCKIENASAALVGVLAGFETKDVTNTKCTNIGDMDSEHYLGPAFCSRVCETENDALINESKCDCGLF